MAKIKNYYFKAMSNGKDIKAIDLYNKYLKNEISIKEKADYINFGIKNSIFNYYDLPVIVLVFMGVQSIGKSTLSNEISLSFFNVSGMRCTEGIWMAVSVFKGLKEDKKCDKTCIYCSKNECYLLSHDSEIKCICKNCCCGEKCCLYNDEDNIKLSQSFCKKICALPKGHKEKYKHICEISPYSHGFICVSLDFEGLGTFERSLEQDIDLAMIGAAMGNSLILRVDKTIDRFLSSRLANWAEGSKNINTTKSQNYFGGNLIFCQKDVQNEHTEDIKKEFDKQINNSVNNWLNVENERKIREINIKDFPIYGIFSQFINSPTPFFNQGQFYSFLRKQLIHLLIKDTLIQKSLPRYRTGCEFMDSLKNILAIVDIHDYNVLDSIAIENLKEYIMENKNKAIEILGVYQNNGKKNYESFEELENDLKSNLEMLKYSYISNKEINIEENIIFEISCKENRFIKTKIKDGDFELKIKLMPYNYNKNNCLSPKLNGKKVKRFTNLIQNEMYENNNNKIVKKNDSCKNLIKLNDQNSGFKQILQIEGIKDFGLLLLIPLEYKDIFSLEDIKNKLFSLWIKIGENINLSIPEIINNFDLFINEIMNRRERNINNWITKITSSFDKESIRTLENLNISLIEKWKICKETCSSCFYKCTKTLGHTNEHNCGFDHLCHERCQTCINIDCEENNKCDKTCHNHKAGHFKEPHSCSHIHYCQKICSQNKLRGCSHKCKLEYGHKEKCFCKEIHLCDKFCIYKDYSKDCKIYCCLEYGHNEDHICLINEHKCSLECSLKNISQGCINDGICCLNLPHSIDNHNCGGQHKCIEICYLKDKAENCGKICTLPYGHYGEHICNKVHKCKEKCTFFGNSRGCKENCSLNYGHDSFHNCNEKHFCNNNCYYYKKSESCIDDKCCLEYDHSGKCNCGVEKHLCSKNCSREQCQRKCKLIYDHKEELHDCNEFHHCFKECSLKFNSKQGTCGISCKYELNHEGECFCIMEKENHICNKNCKKCSAPCKFNANHEGECICGKCICEKDCIYKNKSHNCKQKCEELYGHKGDHICKEKIHLCNEKCIYESQTRINNGGCKIYCGFPVNHDESIDHTCGVAKDKHICSGTCSLFDKSLKNTCGQFCNKPIYHEGPCLCKYSNEKHICNKKCPLEGKKGCKIQCSLSTNHEGECLCSAGKKSHLCDKECSYFKNTLKGCKGKCELPYDHSNDQPCICSNNIKDHIHKGICFLKSKSREGCSIQCKYPVNHEGECECENSSNLHICNQICYLNNKSFKGSCHKDCIKEANHSDEHFCSSKRHECKEPCKYKEKSKAGCLGHCCKDVGHKDVFLPMLFNPDHICQNDKEKHICNKECELKNKSRGGCKGICDKQIDHPGSHDCKSNNHLCKEPCYYFDKAVKACNKYCNKQVGHKDLHQCDIKIHFCFGICHLNKISRFCNSECILESEHPGACLCKKKVNEHFCSKKCKLCGDYCCHEYGHSGLHLCNNEHDCSKICNVDGYCEIKTNNIIEKKILYTLKNNQKIEFIENTEQIFKRKKCILKIPKGFIEHKGKHICDINKHKCGFKCKLCERLCELEYGHKDFHYCKHGHIKNAIIQTEDKSVDIYFNEQKFGFTNDEEAIMFTCYQYCREQKRGHIHRFNKDSININDYISNENIRKLNKYTYECKCEFFWKKFLNFRFETEFNNDLIQEFNKCPSRCIVCQKFNDITYCDLKLWHEEKEHNFPCEHGKQIPYHTIFIIDKSESMGSLDIKPSNSKLYKNENFNNRLGCVIQAMDNYVMKRENINNNDLFSLITFSTKAQINFRDYNKSTFSDVDFIEECMGLIGYPEGVTYFKKGFEEADKILLDIDKQKFNPLIIFFSDGDDFEPNETIVYVKNVSTYNY